MHFQGDSQKKDQGIYFLGHRGWRAWPDLNGHLGLSRNLLYPVELQALFPVPTKGRYLSFHGAG